MSPSGCITLKKQKQTSINISSFSSCPPCYKCSSQNVSVCASTFCRITTAAAVPRNISFHRASAHNPLTAVVPGTAEELPSSSSLLPLPTNMGSRGSNEPLRTGKGLVRWSEDAEAEAATDATQARPRLRSAGLGTASGGEQLQQEKEEKDHLICLFCHRYKGAC